ncbi:hypothetical protein [Streptomyces europaeiscabiei]|uniref:hypothetical protein n=1 Tax=Streptomyces europaeiscabiei TaxID=146819 RepID=UPI0029BB0300|nr:hypothetical protein [Streptomyces europaeiscabiei]MDX2528026.1 hypothetical protein [Streptomyces europaeiscabiei]MDX3839589.1 hypothetical protein [Streptomyces europaeiscabiei]
MMARIELTVREEAQVAVARETLADVDGVDLSDASQAARMVGRLEASLRSLLAIVDGGDQS